MKTGDYKYKFYKTFYYIKIMLLFLRLGKKPIKGNVYYIVQIIDYMVYVSVQIRYKLDNNDIVYFEKEMIEKYIQLLITLSGYKYNEIFKKYVSNNNYWYEMNKSLLQKMPDMLNKIIEINMIHPKFKKEYPHIMCGSKLNLI